MITIDQITTAHKIDKNKENFPVNTIRLFYLIFIYSLVTDNPLEKAEKMIEAIPIIGSILEKRTDLRLSGEKQDINAEWLAVKEEITKLNLIIDSPINKTTFTHLFSTILPAQEILLFNIVNQAQGEGKTFSPSDIIATLKLRAMDSISYSSFVTSLINMPEHELAIHYLTNLAYQVNDLLDSILFAKEDTDNNNFSPFEVIRKSAKDSAEARMIIKSILDKLIEDKKQVSLPPQTQQLVDQFFTMLIGILGDMGTTSETTPQE
ncbi:MAG: hypothetical protein OEX81_01875 [Candidatus Pacebacteria bacterium]|nr:hypothetical protein [Candidatus Paceibacterota bacterium]